MSIPESLKDALLQGTCVPFVGAGVAMAVKRADGSPLFPSWSELLGKCADRLDKEKKPSEANLVRAMLAVGTPDYLYTARKAREYLGDAVWFKVLTSELDPELANADRTSLALPRAIWELGSKLVITTNFDRTLQWAAPDQADLQIWEIEARAPMTSALDSLRRRTVWHLHGHIQNPTDLVLTPDGYELLYGSHIVESKYQAAIQTLRQAIAARTLLFIGFSGDDAYITSQLNRIDQIFGGAAGPHFILEREGCGKNLKGLNLPLETVKFKDFGEPLLDLLKEMGSHAKADKPAQPHNTLSAIANVPEQRATAVLDSKQVPTRSMGELTDVDGFDPTLVKRYRQQLRLDAQTLYPKSLTDEEFLDRAGYRRDGFLTLGGVLLFTTTPSAAAPIDLGSAILQCVVYGGPTKTAERTRSRFAGSVLQQIVDARDFIANHIKWVELPAEHTMQSVIEYEYPMICVREMIANALCHRNYNDGDRMTHIRIFSDRIEISSPGIWHGARPVGAGPHTVDKYRSESIQRNMHLSHGVSMVSIVEMEGSGIPTSIYNCDVRDAPLPTVIEADGFVQVTIYPRRTWENKVIQGRVYSRVSTDVEALQQLLSTAISNGDRKAVAEYSTNLASVYLGIRSYNEAREYSERAIEVATELHLDKVLEQARFISIKAAMMLDRGV